MTRRTIIVELWDNDPSVEAEESLVARFDGYITEDDNNQAIQQIIMEEDVAGLLSEYNEKVVEKVNKEILNRTGQEVLLKERKLKDLDWVVK